MNLRILTQVISQSLTRIPDQSSTASADMGMSAPSVVLLDVLSSTPAEPTVARLAFTPVCATSLRNLV